MKEFFYSALVGLVAMLFVAGVFNMRPVNTVHTMYLGIVQVLVTMIFLALFNVKEK